MFLLLPGSRGADVFGGRGERAGHNQAYRHDRAEIHGDYQQ
jgi:hypothetical protein